MNQLLNRRRKIFKQSELQFMYRLIFLFNLIISGVFSVAQTNSLKYDTVSLSLDSAQSQFLNKNLLLLSQKYNVAATGALIIQARLWPNPNVNLTQGAYNTRTQKWFETNTTNGEEAAQLSQLILLAGKIKKQVKMAETNYQIAEYQLYDLLRTLKFALRSSFFNIYYLQQTAKVYDEEISSLLLIVKVFEQQKSKDYVSEADLVRVQAQLYSLQSEYQNLIDNLNDQQSQLRLLLQVASNVYIKPLVNAEGLKAADPLAYGLKSLFDSAYINRPDLMIAKANLILSKQNYYYQKALAIPDITLGVNYDKLGSYIQNFNAINLGFDIPIFNRNQGNIKSAKIMIDYNDAQLQSTQKSLEEQIMRGMQKAIDADKLYKSIDPTFALHFDELARGMVDNYMKRNVNLLTFLNFYDSYKQNIVQLNSILYNKVNSLESINCYTGTIFFNN